MGKKVIISIASRDYLDSVGGAEKAIAVQQKQFNFSNYEYVYIFPIKKKMGIISISMWGCRINGIYVGAFSEYSLLSHLKQSYSQNICAIMIHHLRFVDLEGLEMLLKAIEKAPIYVYLHDYYLICNQYNLLKNGIKYCGGIGEDCNTCEFKDHTIQNKIRNVFNKFLDRLTFIAPSEIAKQIFAKNYPQYSRYTRVILHQTLKGMYKKNKQVIYIVGGVCALVLVFCLFNSIKGIFGGATSVGVGETLKINNKDYKLNIKAGNIEDYTSTDSEQYKILKLDVTNNNSESAQMGVTLVSGINFSLVDSQNSEIASSDPYLSKSYLIFDTGFNNKILYTYTIFILAVFPALCNHHPNPIWIFMLFDKKADPHRKHLVFYDTLLYNKGVFPFESMKNMNEMLYLYK